MTPRARGVRLGQLALLQVAFAACLASCAGGGSSGSSILPTQANAANVSTTPESLIPPMQGTMPSTRPSPAAGGDASPVIANPASTAPVPVTMTYAFGAHVTAAQSVSHRRVIQDAAYTGYTSTAAPISISLSVTPIGGSTSNYAGSCTATTTGTAGTCTVTFVAPPGPTTFAGSLTESGNTIASFSQTQIIAPGSANTLNFTANPVISSISLGLANPTVYGGTAVDDLLTVNAKDAAGNTIVGNAPYVDVNGKPVAISLNVINSQAGGRGTVTIRGPIRITTPGQAAIYAHYDGKWLQSATLTATTNSPIIAVTSVSLPVTPNSVVMATSTGSRYGGITNGPDGALWFAEPQAVKIGRVTTSGALTEFSTGLTGTTNEITSGPDGNVWFTEASSNKIGRITLQGVITEFAPPTASSNPLSIVSGADGNVWFYESAANRIGRITSTGIITEYPAPPNTNFLGGSVRLILGADGNIWFGDDSNDGVVHYITARGFIGTINGTVGQSLSITLGPDGNIWLPQYPSSRLSKITPSGLVTNYATSTPYGLGNILTGPDAYFWVIPNSSSSQLYRISTAGITSAFSTGVGNLASITVGSDGNIWATRAVGNNIVKFTF